MKIVVGLGNMGKEFDDTIHNMGFVTVDKLCKEINFSFKKNICSSLVAEGNYQGEKVILAKPTTYMNNSGIAVKSLITKYGVQLKDILIISDDIDLPRGKVRVRQSGSAGTHNGLKSVVEYLGSTEFNRVRIGVGKPSEGQDLADFVLSSCHLDDVLESGLEKGKEAALMFIQGKSLNEIMQKVN